MFLSNIKKMNRKSDTILLNRLNELEQMIMNDCVNETTNNSKKNDEVILNDIIGIQKFRQFASNQISSYEYGIKTLNEINDNVLKYICNYNRCNYYEIRSSIYSIKQLIMQSQDTFRKNMNDTNNFSKDIENSLIYTNNELIRIKNDTNDYDKLKIDNQNMRDYVQVLEHKIQALTSTRISDEDVNAMKKLNESLKLDRRKLKCERLSLLNQIKELYKTVETKENEIRDFLRHYENKTKETSNAVKRLIDGKFEIENEKNKLFNENLSLIEKNNQLKTVIDTKDATIKSLQKQINEIKNKWPRYSYGKESDYGYASCKSSDTLRNSIILEGNNTLAKMNDQQLHNQRDSIADYMSTSIISNSNTTKQHFTYQSIDQLQDTTNTSSDDYKVLQNNVNTNMTSPTASFGSSYSASNTSEDISKDLHASLPIMNHSLTVCDDEVTCTAQIMSMSLNMANKNNFNLYSSTNANSQNNDVTKQNNVKHSVSSIDGVSSEDTSSGSLFLTNSYMSTNNQNDTYYNKVNDKIDCITDTQIEIDKWQSNTIKVWLESIGMLPTHVKNALKHLKNGKALLSLTENDLENVFFISNQMHKRKIKLALDELKHPDKCKHKYLSNINNKWVCNQFLKDIGLRQYHSIFKLNLIDGRVLASLQRKDIEKYLGVHKRIHQTSILMAIELLRKYEFNIDNLKNIRDNGEDPLVWTNDSFINWLKIVNLQTYEDNLCESGLHGGLLLDSTFNVDYLSEALRIDEFINQTHKKLVEEEIKQLKKFKVTKQESSVFQRSISSFKTDKKLFTLRGSLGRALGRKVRHDISSPLIDDVTYKRIEFNHKIVDVKSFHMSSVV